MTGRSGILNDAHVLLVGTTGWVDSVATALRTRTDATVRTVPTAAAAVRAVRTDAVDCVLSEHDLEDRTGLGLLRTIRGESSIPVVLCTATGSESIASEAFAGGASDYIALDGAAADPVDEILERTERCLRSSRRRRTRRDRARQFDAIFHDARTLTWVLDSAGSLRRVNGPARQLVGEGAGELVGQPFWTLPWWPAEPESRADVRQVIETAIDGEFGHAVLTRLAGSGEIDMLELSARPVHDERESVVSIVVEGVDITDRVSIERELRQSEELHRVTLNNMTDTVLITDEAGAYTYVCPNVHFIFGYTAAEIRELGTIDALLGPDLFDRDALAETGVLKNIECRATDKAGRTHTLLINVREVSIQDGTRLYSCRDITKRKQRETALATLQETARDFLYATSPREIAQQVVEDTADVIGLDPSAVYLFDADSNELQPVARTDAMARLHGPMVPHPTDGTDLTSRSFVEGETRVLSDARGANGFGNQASGLGSVTTIPLGDHGVFLVGSGEIGQFDPVRRELADLLAATAEAALDRVRRENRLRDQERELQRRNRQLTELNRINGIIREIDQALVQAETRSEIDHAVAELLTTDDRFRFAWVGDVDPLGEMVEPRAWGGTEQGYLDSIEVSVADSATDPAGRTAASREATFLPRIADQLHGAAWRKEAVARNYLSALSVPLAYDDLSYGVLTVYADVPEAFDALAREVLVELGETIASATSAIERKNALLSTTMTRAEFVAADPMFVLSRLAATADCTVTYRGGVQQTADGSFVFVAVSDAPLDHIEAVAADLVAIDGVHRLSGGDDDGMLRLNLARPFLALELADHGAILRSATAGERTSLVVDVPERVDLRHITKRITDRVGDVELRSKQPIERSPATDLPSRLLDRLTDRQLEVVQTAYYSGYFESPRERTGEDVAETLGISSQAFYQHARTVQRKLFSMLFDEAAAESVQATD